MREYAIRVTGMRYQGDEQILRDELIRVPGIDYAEPNADSGEVRIYDGLLEKEGGRQAIMEARARKAILDAGYEPQSCCKARTVAQVSPLRRVASLAVSTAERSHKQELRILSAVKQELVMHILRQKS